MKTLNTIVKLLTALAAVAGAIYVIATYGEQIVAWAKKLMGSFPKCPCCDCTCTDEAFDEAPAEEVPVEEDAPAEEAPAAEEVPVEDAPAEEPAPAVSEPVAEETDFAE